MRLSESDWLWWVGENLVYHQIRFWIADFSLRESLFLISHGLDSVRFDGQLSLALRRALLRVLLGLADPMSLLTYEALPCNDQFGLALGLRVFTLDSAVAFLSLATRLQAGPVVERTVATGGGRPGLQLARSIVERTVAEETLLLQVVFILDDVTYMRVLLSQSHGLAAGVRSGRCIWLKLILVNDGEQALLVASGTPGLEPAVSVVGHGVDGPGLKQNRVLQQRLPRRLILPLLVRTRHHHATGGLLEHARVGLVRLHGR